MNSIKKPYFENLDPLRFIAFLCVFCSHCVGFFGYQFPNQFAELFHKHFFLNGNLGVSFFFVLSGFLITWILLDDKNVNNRIHVGAFYMRRVLRIWPVYFTVVLIGFLIARFNSTILTANLFPFQIQPERIKWYLLFLSNYDIIINGISSVPLSVLWSVSIEEQFYLVWPLLLLFFSRRAIPCICWLIVIASFIARCFPSALSIYSTQEVMSDLAVGGLLAYYCLYRPAFTKFFQMLSRKKIILIYILLLLYIPAKGFSHIFGSHVYLIYYPFEALIFSGFFSFIILEQNFGTNSFYKFGKIRFLTKLGKMSYGLYAYHMLTFPLAFLIAAKLDLQSDSFLSYLIKISTSFIITIIVSYLSYHYFEKKFLSLKRHFQPQSAEFERSAQTTASQ
jgi:peptidoglycan/LPS O-acetylase OafA/YrhL